MSSVVLSMFDYSGVAVRDWALAGYECWCVDIEHNGNEMRDGIRFIKADARYYRPPCRTEYAMCFCWPPCTHLSISGARWFRGKGLPALAASIDLVAHAAAIAEATGAPYLIEQPMSMLSSYWREPDYKFDPCQYGLYLEPPGDAYTKQTWIWTGGGFKMPNVMGVDPVHGSKMHRMPPSKDRARIRAMTPKGFARAVFLANHTEAHRTC